MELIARFQQLHMGFIDPAKNEIICKVVYYGPALAGKSTSIQYIHEHTPTEFKNPLVSLFTNYNRVLINEFINPKWQKIHGYTLCLHLHTISGAIFYEVGRVNLLRQVDAIIFVADSQIERKDANIESFYGLQKNLKLLAYDLKALPYVLQINKCDLSGRVASVKEIVEDIFYFNEPVVASVAYKGIGVFDALDLLIKQIIDKWSGQPLAELQEKHQRKTQAELDKSLIEHLINILQTDNDKHICSAVVWLLKEYNSEKLFELLAAYDESKLFDLLVPYLNHADDAVKFWVMQALKRWDKERARIINNREGLWD